MRQAYRTGTSIAALVREHGVSRGAIRTAVADLLPNQPEKPVVTTEPETVIVEMPGKIARHLHSRDDLDEAQRHALLHGRTVRRGARVAHRPVRSRAGCRSSLWISTG